MPRRKPQRAAQGTELTRHASLECIPLRNPQVLTEPREDGLMLRYQVKVKPWFQWLSRHLLSSESTVLDKKLELDLLGSTVWEMIDGHQSVREIARDFQDQHQLDPREAELAVSGFLRELGKRGLVAMRMKEVRPSQGCK